MALSEGELLRRQDVIANRVQQTLLDNVPDGTGHITFLEVSAVVWDHPEGDPAVYLTDAEEGQYVVSVTRDREGRRRPGSLPPREQRPPREDPPR